MLTRYVTLRVTRNALRVTPHLGNEAGTHTCDWVHRHAGATRLPRTSSSAELPLEAVYGDSWTPTAKARGTAERRNARHKEFFKLFLIFSVSYRAGATRLPRTSSSAALPLGLPRRYFNELRLNVTLDRYFIKITKQEFCRIKNKNFHFSCKLSFDTSGHP